MILVVMVDQDGHGGRCLDNDCANRGGHGLADHDDDYCGGHGPDIDHDDRGGPDIDVFDCGGGRRCKFIES